MYVNTLDGKILGASQKCYFLQIFKILVVSDKTIHRAFRIHNTLYTKPISDFLFFFSFHYTCSYQN